MLMDADATAVARFDGEKASKATLKVIRQAFEVAGLRFTDDGGVVPPGKGETK